MTGSTANVRHVRSVLRNLRACLLFVSLLLPLSFGAMPAVVGVAQDAKPVKNKARLEKSDTSPDAKPATRKPKPELAGEWRCLLSDGLDGWEPYTGVPHKSVKIDNFPKSKSLDCRRGKAFGVGDPLQVFQIRQIEGKPHLYVSGEAYAGLTSKEEFGNYHFSTEFKWGQKKWPPRLGKKRNSGILIHCTGKYGAFWNVWMRCLQCQIQKGDCGDFIQLAGASCQLRATPESAGSPFPTHSADGNWCTVGPGVRRWGAKHSNNHEIMGRWNKVEIFTIGGRVIFAINGHAVMHLNDTKIGNFAKGRPLVSGKIQIQSEAAEIWYRDMKIRPIDELPKKFASHFED